MRVRASALSPSENVPMLFVMATASGGELVVNEATRTLAAADHRLNPFKLIR